MVDALIRFGGLFSLLLVPLIGVGCSDAPSTSINGGTEGINSSQNGVDRQATILRSDEGHDQRSPVTSLPDSDLSSPVSPFGVSPFANDPNNPGAPPRPLPLGELPSTPSPSRTR